MKNSYFLGISLVAISVALSGCSNKTIGQRVGDTMTEKTIEAQTGAKVNVDSNGENVTIKTKDGQTQYSAGGAVKLPDDFPKELIAASDAKLIMSSSSEGGSSLTYLTNDDMTKVSEKYISSLTGAGWKKEMETSTAQAIMLNFSKDKKTAFIIVGTNDSKDQTEKTTVNITYTVEK